MLCIFKRLGFKKQYTKVNKFVLIVVPVIFMAFFIIIKK